MKNKKLLYGLLGIGAIAGFYFYNKNKMPKKINCPKGTKPTKRTIYCKQAPCPQEIACA
jgi:hypothetical protein